MSMPRCPQLNQLSITAAPLCKFTDHIVYAGLQNGSLLRPAHPRTFRVANQHAQKYRPPRFAPDNPILHSAVALQSGHAPLLRWLKIAERLVIATNTVKRHINHIFSKLGVTTRVQAIVKAKEVGVL